ncbi:MAG: hypothetical protein P4L59_19925 [Desulfosporosinus sp.]|nr:hypothetical protein [Desulfosporosinus sp.]
MQRSAKFLPNNERKRFCVKKLNGSHATEQDVPSVECAKDGIAFDQKAQRFCVLALATSE